MKFYSSNHSINIQKSIGTLTHKVGVHLGMCGLFPHTLLHSWECECDYLVTLSAHTFPCFALITSPKLRSWHFQTFQLFPSFFSTSFRIQLGLPHTSIAGISWCGCTHPIDFMGIHLLHRVHGNKCIGTHDVIHNTLAPLREMLASTWDNNNYMHLFQSHPTPFTNESTLCLTKMAFAP
jgi:hypothetical protein